MATNSIKITNAALEEGPNDTIRLRGVVDSSCLHLLKSAPYQREALPLAKLGDLIEVYKTGGSVPDIELGMRGQHYVTRGDDFYLQDDVFMIDGLQRVTAAIQAMQLGCELPPRIGARISFSTDEKWEREQFRILNQDRTKLSPSILIRNMKETNEAVAMLYNLCKDSSFVLNGRVCWQQGMNRTELVTALTFLKVAGRLHGFTGRGRSNNQAEVASALERSMKTVGRNIMRDNLKTFFDVVEQCWGIRRVTYKQGAAHLSTTFMSCLADLFSNHYDFWKGDNETRLFVSQDLIRKLALFPIVSDPGVSNLAGSGGKAMEMLYTLLFNHINSGKRTRRLKTRGTPTLVMVDPGSMNSMPGNDDEPAASASG